MCGRYANFLTEQELVDAFEIAVIADDARLAPRYNIGPMQDSSIVVARKEGGRTLETARWGLVPVWAKEPGVGVRAFNARSETVAEKPTFRSAFGKRRCLVPASGYFEWHTVGKEKTPYFIHREDDAPLAFAGLYDFWKDKSLGDEAPWLATFSIVTCAARGEMTAIHDREPVMLGAEAAEAWLDAESTQDDLFAAIGEPFPELEWHAVSKAVGNVRNQGPELVEPV